MTAAPRILVLSVPIGAGHHRAAEGLCEAIRAKRPGTRWEILDALRYMGPDGGELAKKLYFGVLEDVPDLWGAVYEQRGLSELLRPAGEVVDDLRVASLLPELARFAPDVILAMHPFAVGLASALRRAGHARCPVVAVLTDFDAHPAWIGRGIDLYLTATFRMVETLEARGLPTGAAVASGIPLRPAFARIREDRGARARLGLDASRFTVLLLGGGLGLGPIGEVARALAQVDAPLSLVLVAGKNAELEREAREWAERSRVPLHVTGLVENVWDYVAAADVAVGKPGGLTCAELLAAGVPLVALDPIPGQEQANCDALVREWAAVEARDVESVCRTVLRLRNTPAELDRMRAAALRLGRPMAAGLAAGHVLALLDGWVPSVAPGAPRPDDPLARLARDAKREIGSITASIRGKEIEDELRRLKRKLGL